jgi:Na+-transporting methylmalonyl-CoA/oxaloacetate decarboxylase beta subunit
MEKKIIFLIILAVVFIFTVTFIGYLVSNNGIITPNVTIVGGDDGPTAIHISLSIPPWLILINSLLIISILITIGMIIFLLIKNKFRKDKNKEGLSA